MTDGTVTISLADYEMMKSRIGQLEMQNINLQSELKEAKEKVWKIFGPPFQKPRHTIAYDTPAEFTTTFAVRYEAPGVTTRVNIMNEDFMYMSSNWNQISDVVIRELIQHHIVDVIKGIKFDGIDEYVQSKERAFKKFKKLYPTNSIREHIEERKTNLGWWSLRRVDA